MRINTNVINFENGQFYVGDDVIPDGMSPAEWFLIDLNDPLMVVC